MRISAGEKKRQLILESALNVIAMEGVDLIKQYIALMETEDFHLAFTEDGIDALADIATEVNATVENIGARRLQTVLERVLEEISFSAADRAGESLTIDADYVRNNIGDLAKNADLSKFIL